MGRAIASREGQDRLCQSITKRPRTRVTVGGSEAQSQPYHQPLHLDAQTLDQTRLNSASSWSLGGVFSYGRIPDVHVLSAFPGAVTASVTATCPADIAVTCAVSLVTTEHMSFALSPSLLARAAGRSPVAMPEV